MLNLVTHESQNTYLPESMRAEDNPLTDPKFANMLLYFDRSLTKSQIDQASQFGRDDVNERRAQSYFSSG